MNYLDTYALIEIGLDNPNYRSTREEDFRVCDVTLAEFHFVNLREGKKDAEEWTMKIRPHSEPTSLDWMIEAVEFRAAHRSLNLSFPDVVGYIHARKNNGVFVTGDKAFEKLPHVKYVK